METIPNEAVAIILREIATVAFFTQLFVSVVRYVLRDKGLEGWKLLVVAFAWGIVCAFGVNSMHHVEYTLQTVVQTLFFGLLSGALSVGSVEIQKKGNPTVVTDLGAIKVETKQITEVPHE